MGNTSPDGRGFTTRQVGIAGVVVLTVAAVSLYLLMLRYTGRFEEKVGVVAMMTSTGDGLPQRADVKFRGMIVGVVSGVDVVAKGERQAVALDLDPALAAAIPANVTARVVPNNIFGVAGVELLDNAPTAARLSAGAEIAEDTSESTVQLQTTLNVLKNVLDNIQPEKLGRVLGTLADALDPSARMPGSTVERLDRWVTDIRSIEGVGTLLGDLGAAAQALSHSAPELVTTLGASVHSARTITERRAGLVALLASANGTVGSLDALFAANPGAGITLVHGLNDTFGALAADPNALPEAAANFNASLKELATVFHWGPSKQMVWEITASLTPFQQYVAADCPRYGELAGPRCGGSTVPDAAPPQDYPRQMLPRHLGIAGPAPVAPVPAVPGTAPIPGLPAIPGLPSIPGLPAVPGVTAPAADSGDPARAGATPIATGLQGPAAVAAVVGGQPTGAQMVLLAPLLTGGTVTVHETSERSR